MANTVLNLYDKYRNKVERTLENDKYYQYLLELLHESDATITQTNRVLHKEVDERWLIALEEAIPAINTIITRPRSFIKSVESLVPIELARKITSQAVRHLSQNTQNITSIQNGDIMPGKILNVSAEESLDLYENRFIYTLILKLMSFIDKRIDIMFWSTGDERHSLLKIDTELEDDFEKIEYRLEMVIKNKQSYLENDAEQMETFKRIDRVRRIIGEFRRSKFMLAMSNSGTIRSPIQRTNLIVKEPNYRKCFDLWRFLEGYDEVGYSVDIKDTALDFDEDYLYQMYGNIALNYTVFKTILDADPRRISDAPAKRRKVLKPKFIKKIVEEIVDDYDIPDVEIRKVIIEEITKAQALIEKRRTEKERAELKAQKEKERAAAQKTREQEKLKKQKAAEQEKLQKQKTAEQEKLKKQKTAEQEKLKKQKAAEQEKLKKQKAAEQEKLKKQKAAEQEKLQKQKTAEQEKFKKQKTAEQEKFKKQKAAEQEKLKKQKAAEQEKLKKQKAAEQEKLKNQKELQKKKEQVVLPPKEQKTPPVPITDIREPRVSQTTSEQEKLMWEKASEQEKMLRQRASAQEKVLRQKSSEQEKHMREKALEIEKIVSEQDEND